MRTGNHPVLYVWPVSGWCEECVETGESSTALDVSLEIEFALTFGAAWWAAGSLRPRRVRVYVVLRARYRLMRARVPHRGEQ